MPSKRSPSKKRSPIKRVRRRSPSTKTDTIETRVRRKSSSLPATKKFEAERMAYYSPSYVTDDKGRSKVYKKPGEIPLLEAVAFSISKGGDGTKEGNEYDKAIFQKNRKYFQKYHPYIDEEELQ